MHPFGQVDIQPAAKADQPETLAGANTVTGAFPAHDPPCDQPSDLNHGNGAAIGDFDGQRVAFVLFRRLVERCVEEFSRPIDHRRDLSGNRRTVHVAVEDRHEDRDPDQSLGAKTQALGWDRPFDKADHAIRRTDQKAGVFRHCPFWVAEKVIAPDGQPDADPAKRLPNPEQDQRHRRKDGNELPPLGVHRLEEGIEHFHAGLSIPAARGDQWLRARTPPILHPGVFKNSGPEPLTAPVRCLRGNRRMRSGRDYHSLALGQFTHLRLQLFERPHLDLTDAFAADAVA